MSTPSKTGFTVVELAVVLLIFGLTFSMLALVVDRYNKYITTEKTNTSIKILEQALLEYRALYNVYPCPADPSLGPDDPNYGREIRVTTLGAPSTLGTTPSFFTDACAANVAAGPAPNRVPSTLTPPLDKDGDGVADNVIIGSIPFSSLIDPDGNPATEDGVTSGLNALTEYASIDGWGSKFLYAISENLTNASKYNDPDGAVQVFDENRQSILSPGVYAHAVIVSHGPNTRGAYSRTGQLIEGCPVGGMPIAIFPEVATNANETENCDYDDDEFLSGLRYERDHSFNDDIVKVLNAKNSNLWVFNSPTSITNTNFGFVGIGTNTPAHQLDVVGDISGTEIRALSYRNTVNDPTRELLAQTLGGDGINNAAMKCPDGEFVTSIENSTVNCAPAFPSMNNLNCPTAGWVIKSISSSTGLNCCDPTVPVGGPNSC